MQSSLTFVLTVAVACFALCNGQDIEYQCTINSVTNELSMVVRTPYVAGDAESITALDLTNNVARGCRSTTTKTVDTVEYLELVIVTDSAGDQLQPPPSDTCFVVENTAGGGVLDYAIVVESSATFMHGSDLYYTFSCDPASATGDSFTIQNQQIAVGTYLSNNEIELTESGQTIAIAMKTTSGISVTSSATLGAIVQFELTYTRDASATVPLFLQVDRVTVHDSPGFDGNSEDLLTGGGCLPSPNGIFDLSAPFTVTDVGTLNPETNTTVIATSGVFEIAVFDSSNELHFEFVFENDRCYSTTEAECFDPDAFCNPPGAGRRKRSATDDTNNSTLQFTVAVNVGRLSNQEGEEVSETECEAMTSFWVVSIVLGVLLLVVLVFAVMLFYRLKTEQGKKQVDREMFGTKNPTF